MADIDKRIIRFIERHHVVTLATVSEEGLPYCATCFYAYDRDRNMLVFTSGEETRHGCEMERNPHVAAAIALETRIVGRVQGLQICGTAEHGDDNAMHTYLAKFPYAAVMKLELWMLRPDFMKLTDNTLGFGKKLIWKLQEQE